jgi:hypothetical protein
MQVIAHRLHPLSHPPGLRLHVRALDLFQVSGQVEGQGEASVVQGEVLFDLHRGLVLEVVGGSPHANIRVLK